MRKWLIKNRENLMIFSFLYFSIFNQISFRFIVGYSVSVYNNLLCIALSVVWPLYIASLGLNNTNVQPVPLIFIGIFLLFPGLHMYTLFWRFVESATEFEVPRFVTYLYLYLYYLLYYWLYRFCKQRSS